MNTRSLYSSYSRYSYKTVQVVLTLLMSTIVCWLSSGALQAAAITYVQGNSATPQTAQTSITVTFNAAQNAGDLNVVVVGWNDSIASVASVTDKTGNTYTRAIGPTAITGIESQSIYYAKNILSSTAGGNSVTVTFSTAAAFPDIRILEYSGVDLNNPVDVTAAASGNSGSANSGSITTSNATDLLFGADMVQTVTTAVGSGFTSRLLTSPDGDLAEDRMVSATGNYNATASLSSGRWIMQMVAFRTPGSGDTTPPTAPTNLTATVSGSQINLSWTGSTDNVGVTGYRVERCQGVGCSTFTQIATPTATTYSDTGLVAGSYSYRVRAADAAGNLSGYSNVATGSIPDTTPPTVPANLTAAVSGSQINLSWAASTDNVGVTGYLVERCQGTGCSAFTQIGTAATNAYSDTGLALGSYSYRVRAKDATGNLSGYSNVATGTITDTQAPTAPTNLTATVSGSQINLSWTASTDNVGVTGYRVERCQGVGCSTFTQIATPTATTYSDTGLVAGSYSYRVRAADAAGNLSGYSNVAAGNIPDTTAPTAPSNLTTVAASSSQINLSWTASTDNVGVTSYLVERCQGTGCTTFTQIATPTTTTYSDIGLAANTTYSYRVRATDAAGNLSPYSNTASATTASSNATITFVQGASATPQTAQISVNVPFTAAQNAGDVNVVVVGWNDSIASVASVTDKIGNTYTRAVGPTAITGVESQSIYYAKNILPAAAGGNAVTVTFSAAAAFPDVRILEYRGADLNNPIDVTAAATGNSATANSGSVATANPTDLLFGADMVQTTTTAVGTGFTSRLLTSPDGDLAEDQMVTATGSYSATASLSAGQWIMQMVAFRTPGAGDTTPPTAPNNLSAIVSGSQINLSWTASTDNVGVTAYLLERCQGVGCTTFTQIATPTTTTYSDTGLGAGSYSYRVRATDAAGNLSGYSNVATGIIPDNTPPTAPSNLTASAPSSSQINLSWNASTDNVGVTSYLVERCQGTGCTTFTQIATPTTTTYSDTSLAANTSYSYRVRATDVAGNLSSYSNVATATTAALGVPTAPTNVTLIDGGAAPVVAAVQSYINTALLTSHTTAPFDSTGSDLIVICSSSHAGVAFTPTDSFGNTWISLSGPTSTTTGFDLRTGVWYVVNPIVGPGHTVTMGLSAPESLVISVFAVKGSRVISPIDAVSLIGSDKGTQSVNVASPGIVTSAANDLLIGFVKTENSTAFQSGAGFVQQPSASSNFLDAETGASGAPGTYAGTFTINQAETWQSAAVAAATNPNQAVLSWTASTETGGTGTISNYLIERCQGPACSTFSQIATTPATTFNDTGLTPSATYSYRIRAVDTAQTLGPYSSIVTLTIPAPIPTLPGDLAASAVSGTQVNLSWAASSEAGSTVTSYLVERCQGSGCTNFAQIGTSNTTTFNDTGATSSATYSYRVRAMDVGGNLSPYSIIVSATTVSVPTDPTNLVVTAVSATQINLTWTASTEPGGTVTGYLIERCQGIGCSNFSRLLTVPSNNYTDAGLTPSTSYTYRVKATDANGFFSNYSNLSTAVTPAQSATITYVQENFATPQSSQTKVSVTFPAAQVAGDLNVIAVGWNDSTSTITSVTDTSGNAYSPAVGPTSIPGTISQTIYYAKNITAAAAGANSVTVTFSSAAAFPDIRIVEYSGADLVNPVDVTAAATGSGSTSSSGSGTTTSPTDLLFGANMVISTTIGAGTGFTSRIITSPDGDIAEDELVTTIGTYTAGAAVANGQWIMQMVAFRTPAPASGPIVNLSTTSLNFGNQATGSTSSPQTITLTNLGTTQLVINSIALSGGNLGDFSQTNTCPATVAPNGQCTITVTFSPTATGSRASSIGVADNAPGTPQTISLTGTGTGFSVSPQVTALTFSRTQQFNASSGSVTWAVDGVTGGSASTGTITTGGLYTPPSVAGSHTINATTSDHSQSANATVYVTNTAGAFTYHYDNLRTGQNTSETVLSLTNVNPNQFGKLFTYSIDALSYASPLYVANVNIGGTFHNVTYIVTEHDSVYAFDADGLSSSPLWHLTFLKSGVTTIPCADTAECGDIPTEIGITSTPTIDQNSGTMYVVAATKEGTSYVQRLHALDITTGAEKFGGPVVIQASVNGTGTGSVGSQVPFDPLHENQRPALLLNNGIVYMGFGSHGDVNPWHGWILGYNASTLAQVLVYNVTPNGFGGGIWQSGGGITADATGNMYFTSSNGTFDLNTGGLDVADSIEKLSATGVVLDYFTPHDQAVMETNNVELGSAGPVLLIDQPTGPFPHLLVTAGKEGTIYVINRDNMGHFNPSNDNAAVQVLPGILKSDGTQDGGNFSVPIYFNGFLYFASINDTLKSFEMSNGQLLSAPVSQSAVTYPNRGGSFSISANGTNNAILWAIQDNTPSNGTLHAYDASNLAKELYNSDMASGARDSLGVAVKFVVPTVMNGKVYVTVQNQLVVYGLLP